MPQTFKPPPPEVTKLLHEWGAGDREALERLMPVMYVELQRLARRFMRSEAAGHSLQPTALVHEAYLRLMGVSRAACDNRTQFVALAASLMRHVLVDHARSKQRVKRGGQISIVALTDQSPAAPGPGWDVIALDDALSRLANISPVYARVVELRYFAGLSIEETADALQISPATVKRHWTTARAWLFKRMSTPATRDPVAGGS